jgi:hypothetical protein
VVIVVIALLIAILIPALNLARKSARAAVCRSNLRQIGTATASYACDFKSTIFSFSWSHPVGTTTQFPTDYTDLHVASGGGVFEAAAQAYQAVDIIRRRSPNEPNFARIAQWMPAIDYSHLVLIDYLAARLPEPMLVCPEDRPLQLWQSNIPGFNQGIFGAMQPQFSGPLFGAVFRAKPYSSSYEVAPASYDRSPAANRLFQAPLPYNQYWYGSDTGSRFGGRRLEDVAFPSVKFHMYDTHTRHHSRVLYFAHQEAVQPVLQFDAAVLDRRTKDSGRGWSPRHPESPAITNINYIPYSWESPTSTGEQIETFAGHYRWTRGGIRGVDVGPEVKNAY